MGQSPWRFCSGPVAGSQTGQPLAPPRGPAPHGTEGRSQSPSLVPYRSCSSWRPQSALHLHRTPACYTLGPEALARVCRCTNVLWGGRACRGKCAEGSAVVRVTVRTLPVVGGCVWAPPHLGPGRRESPHLWGVPHPLAVTCKQSGVRCEPATAQARLVPLPAPRCSLRSFNSLLLPTWQVLFWVLVIQP